MISKAGKIMSRVLLDDSSLEDSVSFKLCTSAVFPLPVETPQPA